MSFIVQRCLQRTHLVEQLVENWKLEHAAALRALDLEELIGECLDLASLCRLAWKSVHEGLFLPEVPFNKLYPAGILTKQAIDRNIDVIRSVSAFVAISERNATPVARSEELKRALHDMEQLALEAAVQWPKPDEKKGEEAMAAFRKGDYMFAEDMLNELQGGSAKAG